MILAKINPQPGGVYAVSMPYNAQAVEIAHEIPGLVFDRETKAWACYRDALQIFTEKITAQRLAKFKFITSQVKPLSCGDDDRLRSYQREGVDFLFKHASEGVLLADVMGLGKTRTCLVAVEKFGTPAVIVCPASVKRSWIAEGNRIGIDVFPLSGTKPDDNANIEDGIVVINYDIVHAWLPLLIGAKSVVFDEAHYLINERSRRSKACKELAHSCEFRIAATGTPLTNKPKDLWNIVDTISPNRFGKFFYYAKRFCDAHQEAIQLQDGDEKLVWKWDGATNLDELSSRLKHFMIRRTKEDVQLQLPPQIRQTTEVDVASDSLAYEWSLKNSKAARIALSAAAQAKIPHAVEMAKEVLAEGGNVVVFCHEKVVVREMVAALAAAGIENVFSATGDQSVEKRQETAERAQKTGCSVLVVTTHSMGVGINYLTYADHAIFLELDYEPHWMLQAEGRLHRPGQMKTVHIRYLVAIGTIDEAIRDAVLTKMDVFAATFGAVDKGFSKALRGKSEEDSLAEVRDYLSKIGKEYL